MSSVAESRQLARPSASVCSGVKTPLSSRITYFRRAFTAWLSATMKSTVVPSRGSSRRKASVRGPPAYAGSARSR